ncbi:MAG TPA: 1,2-phenylacetyl-CoA epoxidase subunit PaaD [Pseudonocardia sp.]|jgi:ring-1,2-phenylacetyl-CoA epoxidase subunit PaaD|uniref:1,2-phenylacetyl-CoA epoxidase subunit PaaD n=1 Tax=Pseudonocardia sp. TaxID=60912 RepID=UPI002F42ABF8
MVTAEVDSAARARAAIESVSDPELPMLTLADLGVVRAVALAGDHSVTVTITPTYTGCPALAEMRADLRAALAGAGFARVEVRTAFSPPWSTDRITEDGRRKLAEAGIAPPARLGSEARHRAGPVPLHLDPPSPGVRCPHCGAPATEELSRFGPTACTALRRCPSCLEPFEHMKTI